MKYTVKAILKAIDLVPGVLNTHAPGVMSFLGSGWRDYVGVSTRTIMLGEVPTGEDYLILSVTGAGLVTVRMIFAANWGEWDICFLGGELEEFVGGMPKVTEFRP